MSSEATRDHIVYQRVKERLIEEEVRAERRIHVEPLAQQLLVSATPVREALIRLACERVIRDVPRTGFFLKQLSEAELAGLFALQHLLLDWTLHMAGDGSKAGLLKPPNLSEKLPREAEIQSDVVVRLLEDLLVHIARQSGNDDLVYIVSNINDRTHFARKRDHEIFGDPEFQVLRMCQAYQRKDFDALRDHLRTYFQKRSERVPDFLRALRASFARNTA